MWMEFKVKSAIVAELLSVRQHFFRFMCGCAEGLLGRKNFGKLFFVFLNDSFVASLSVSNSEDSAGIASITTRCDALRK
jgi:hypothetical protein